MKRFIWIIVLTSIFMSGCDSLRFAPSESQKQNAWLHDRTTMMAAQTAQAENASARLKALTQLSQNQSRAFTAYYGLPSEFPAADNAEQILAQSNFQLAQSAAKEAADRPDVFNVADNILELAIGVCGLLGGVYGTRAIGFLRQAQTKSKALEEIVAGNELFKKQNPDSTAAFKTAQQNQSSETRQIVAELKT